MPLSTNKPLRGVSDRRHLLRRLVFAATPMVEDKLQGKSVLEALDTLIDASKGALLLSAMPTEPEQLRRWWLREMMAGSAPLRENLALFLHTVLGGSSEPRYNALLRQYAFGKLPDLLQTLGLDATVNFGEQMARYFGVHDPEHRLTAELNDTYRATGGSMEQMLRALAQAEEFWSPETRWNLIKSPVHLAVGACRQLEIRQVPIGLTAWLSASGQKLLEAPNTAGAWLEPADRLAARYQLGAALFGEELPWGLRPAVSSSPPPRGVPAQFRDAKTFDLLQRLDPAPGIDRHRLEEMVAAVPAAQQSQESVRRILATPEYQLA